MARSCRLHSVWKFWGAGDATPPTPNSSYPRRVGRDPMSNSHVGSWTEKGSDMTQCIVSSSVDKFRCGCEVFTCCAASPSCSYVLSRTHITDTPSGAQSLQLCISTNYDLTTTRASARYRTRCYDNRRSSTIGSITCRDSVLESFVLPISPGPFRRKHESTAS